jgi:hypothetical protein
MIENSSMENNKSNVKSGRNRSFFLLLIIILAFIVYYSIMCMIASSRRIDIMQNESESLKSIVTDEKILSDSTYLRLIKDKTFLQSKIIMAESDSIYLTLNLTDSIANLEISGVIVHTSKMSEIKTSKIFYNNDENIIQSLLASPFTISNSFATIRKEPVMIKMAPKDTSEYKPDIMPDTSITEPVNYILEMTNGTRFYVYQEENTKSKDRLKQFTFDISYRFSETWKSLKRVATLKVPEYHPYIKLKIPRADAKIIYRALPKNGQVAVFR